MRIGRTLHISLSFKSLHLSGECRWVRPHGIGEVAHAHRTVVDHLAQNSNGRHTNRDARTNRNQSIKTLAPCDAT
jgi:acyl dehydratase